VALFADHSVAMVAGEASGDLLASRLLSGLRPLLPTANFHGVGGPHMAQYGFKSDWPIDRLAVRGLFEVIQHYREIKGIQTALKQRLLQQPPSVFIGVDAPDFNLSLETTLKQAGIPTIHFISPSIGPGVVAELRKSRLLYPTCWWCFLLRPNYIATLAFL
jgi:lipid-A-disaccharide synthase